MSAGIYHFTCEQGAKFEKNLTIKNPDGTAMNLTGYTARMQVRALREDATTLIELTTANGRITLGGSAGTVDLFISSTDTAALTKDGVYDLELVDGSGEVLRLLKGEFRLDKEVTR